VCPTQNDSSGSLKYPDIDEDKTEVLKKQVDGLVENVKKVFTFTFTFRRTLKEVRLAEQEEGKRRFADSKSHVTSLDVSETGVAKGENWEFHDYSVTVKMTVKQALNLINFYTKNPEQPEERTDFQVRRTWAVKDEQGNIQKVESFTRKPTKQSPNVPRAGIATLSFETPKVKTPAPHMEPQTPVIVVSYEFDILPGYLPGWHANREEYLAIRKGLWHEIMELAILVLAVEALCWPASLYYDCKDYKENNFANNAVARVQRAMEAIKEDRRLFLYWPGDPPFDSFEVSGYTREANARRLEDDAIRLEGQGNWAGAREKWIEAEKAWEIALKAWQAVPRHPDREQRIKAARDRLTQVREKRLIAQWEGASWNVTTTSSGEINIRYSAWPVRFKAKIVDVKGNVLAAFDKPSGTGVITWGKGEKAGLYFIRVEAERVKPMVRKIVIL